MPAAGSEFSRFPEELSARLERSDTGQVNRYSHGPERVVSVARPLSKLDKMGLSALSDTLQKESHMPLTRTFLVSSLAVVLVVRLREGAPRDDRIVCALPPDPESNGKTFMRTMPGTVWPAPCRRNEIVAFF